MPVLLINELPVPREAMEALTETMGVRDDPPDGLIVHVVTDGPNNGCRVVDVWESEDQMRTFAESRLMPAMSKLFPERGIEMRPDQVPPPSVTPAHDLVRGR